MFCLCMISSPPVHLLVQSSRKELCSSRPERDFLAGTHLALNILKLMYLGALPRAFPTLPIAVQLKLVSSITYVIFEGSPPIIRYL